MMRDRAAIKTLLVKAAKLSIGGFSCAVIVCSFFGSSDSGIPTASAASGCRTVTRCTYKRKKDGSEVKYFVEGTECPACKAHTIYKDEDGDKKLELKDCRQDASDECPPAGDKPNWPEVKKHKDTCTAPAPTQDYGKCQEHCQLVDKATESCPKECHGDQGCVASCGGVCKGPLGCRQACEGAVRERRVQWARDVAEKCKAQAPEYDDDCHRWCNDTVKPSHDECVKRCSGDRGCEDMCHSTCGVDGCHAGCNGHKKRPRDPNKEPRDRGGR